MGPRELLLTSNRTKDCPGCPGINARRLRGPSPWRCRGFGEILGGEMQVETLVLKLGCGAWYSMSGSGDTVGSRE